MAGEVNGVNKTGLGFFSSDGQLKSTDQVQKEDSTKQVEKSSGEASESSFSTEVISKSLTKVRSDFRDDVNRAATVINEDDAALKKAQDVVKKQIETAKELKAAIKDKDEDTVNKKTKELAQLQEKREQIAKEVKTNNRQNASDRVVGIRLGNSTLETVKTKEVKFEAKETPSFDKAKDVDKFIDSLKEDKAAIAVQRQDLKEKRVQVKDTLNSGKVQIDKIEQRSIRRFEDATETANRVASQIRSGSQEAFAFNVNESVARALLG